MCVSLFNPDTIGMLPLTLKLKNFLSYRDDVPVLNLEDVHVACLCGPNGHGKSAILDAITWVLWGKARGRTHDQLVHEGQNEMSVGMEFENEGQRYNVIRRFSRARRNTQSSLELLIQSNGDWVPTSIKVEGYDTAEKLILFDDVKYSEYDHKYWDNYELEQDSDRIVIP